MKFLFRFLVFSGLLLTSLSVYAHTPIAGISSFYNGILHPALVPSQLILLIATGILIGQNGVSQNEKAVFSFATFTIIGLIVTGFSSGLELEKWVLGMAAVLGLIVAIKPKLSPVVIVILGGVSGLLMGLDSAQDSLNGRDKVVSLFGSGIGIYFFCLYPMGMADYFRKKEWPSIALRIMGSWVSASALLVMALSLSR